MMCTLIIGTDGTTRHLVDPVSERLAAGIGPKVSTQRSSHVETWHDLSLKARAYVLNHNELIATLDDDTLLALRENADASDITNHFWADMLPVKGPVLGPFEKYEDAIAAEIVYLQEANLPCPLETTDLLSSG